MPSGPQSWVVLHSMIWLTLANLVGVLLALFLVYPELNTLVAPYTYGRVMPLHLNFHLYGWMSVPLLGLLFHWYLPLDLRGARLAFGILLFWSSALAYGGYSWLTGGSSGKVFLDWSGSALVFFVLMLASCWVLLFLGYLRRLRVEDAGEVCIVRALKMGLLLILSLVPAVFLFASDPAVYPPINTLSSGATGASLLASSLAVVVIFVLTPVVVHGLPVNSLLTKYISWVLVAHVVLWLALEHGNSSNNDLSQEVGLGSLFIWVPLLYRYYRGISWSEESIPWLRGFGAWGSVLVVTAVVMFLPGILEHVKFTNALVAHVHLAMAGMLSSFLVILLQSLAPRESILIGLSERTSILLWNAGLSLYLGAMLYVAHNEAQHIDYLYRAYASRKVAFELRLLGGLMMTVASLRWFCCCLCLFRKPAIE